MGKIFLLKLCRLLQQRIFANQQEWDFEKNKINYFIPFVDVGEFLLPNSSINPLYPYILFPPWHGIFSMIKIEILVEDIDCKYNGKSTIV